jgi:hypothetical protein
MKRLIVLSTWFIGGPAAAQTPFFDVPLITETAVGRATLGMPFSELRRIYAGCTFRPAYLAAYGFDEWPEEPDAMIIIKNGHKLFLYHDTYDVVDNKRVHSKKIAGLIVLHPAYLTKQGIHVGSSSAELRRVLPQIVTAPNVIAGINVQDARVPNSPLSYSFLNQKDVGPQRKGHYGEEVPLTSKIGRVSWIQVWSE